MGDSALALGPLDHHRRVVAPFDGLAEAAVAHRLGPAGEQVDVAAEVHQVGQPGSRRAGPDLAEHHLPRRGAVPLHVREPAAEAHRRDHRLAHLPSTREVRVVGIAMGDHLLADPLDLLADERPRPVLADVVEGDLPRRAHGVVRELLTVDELLHADLVDVQQAGERVLQLALVLDAVGVQRSGAGDRLDDQRVADVLGRLRGTPSAVVDRSARRDADAGGGEHVLHPPLVAERERLGDAHARHADRLAQPGGEQHRRLPQRLDEVDVAAAQAVEHRVTWLRPRRPTRRSGCSRRAPGGRPGAAASTCWSPTPITRAPTSARPRVNSGISPG